MGPMRDMAYRRRCAPRSAGGRGVRVGAPVSVQTPEIARSHGAVLGELSHQPIDAPGGPREARAK